MRGITVRSVLLAILIYVPALAEAQGSKTKPPRDQETGTIVGRVLDIKGSPLFGVVLTLEGPSLDEPVRKESDGEGKFVFKKLEPGFYKITAELFGYLTVTQEGIPVEANREIEITIVMNAVETFNK